MWVAIIAGVIFVLAAVRNEDKRKQRQRRMENELLNRSREVREKFL
jgi:preprotein translocase subunit YajC